MGISSWNRINVTAFLNQRPICGINQLYWVLKEILNILNLWRSVTVNKLSMGLVQRRIKILFYRSYLKTKIFPERRIEIVVLQCYPQEARFLRRLIIARSSYKLFFFKEAFWKMLQLRIAFGKVGKSWQLKLSSPRASLKLSLDFTVDRNISYHSTELISIKLF